MIVSLLLWLEATIVKNNHRTKQHNGGCETPLECVLPWFVHVLSYSWSDDFKHKLFHIGLLGLVIFWDVIQVNESVIECYWIENGCVVVWMLFLFDFFKIKFLGLVWFRFPVSLVEIIVVFDSHFVVKVRSDQRFFFKFTFSLVAWK